jgi:aldose 1-epimerase
VQIYTLTNRHGIEARVMSYGAALVSLKTPDREGRMASIVLGVDSLDAHLARVPYYGATVGRYANRIAGGRFTLDGKTYELPRNNGPNSLHGGGVGFDQRVWTADPLRPEEPLLRLHYVSPAGEEGYPGELRAQISYRLGDDDSLEIEYRATTDAPTPVNLANHAYFNLSGDPRASIVDHTLVIDAERFTPVDAAQIPTGELKCVAGTPFDFRTPHLIGERIDADDEQLSIGHGYDHNFVLSATRDALRRAAIATEPDSGRSLEVWTTQPGLQLYSGNFLDGKPAGGGGFAYRTGFCLETQHFPDSPNRPEFPSTILRPGKEYRERTVLKFRALPPAR